MTDNPNKKTFWDKVHLDPTMLLITGIAGLQRPGYLERQRSGYWHDGAQNRPNRDGSGHHGGDGVNSSTRL